MFPLFRAKYSQDNLRKILDEYFGCSPLSACQTEILIPAYELDSRQPHFFRRSTAIRDGGYDISCIDAAISTSAAPTYFPPAKLITPGGDLFTYIDGGIFANNPTMCAIVEAMKLYPMEKEFFVLSLGTGYEDTKVPLLSRWGLIAWVKPLLNLIFDGISDTVEYQAALMPQAKYYYRFQEKVDSKLDDTSPESIEGLRIAGLNLARSHYMEEMVSTLLRERSAKPSK